MTITLPKIGHLNPGPYNKITDVPGVRVGHVTLNEGEIQTGVTAIIPGSGNAFLNKFPAATHVINGFGKSVGLVQIDELGSLESPIILSNTFAVGTCLNAAIRYNLNQNPCIADTTGTVNQVVLECNDQKLNNIRSMPIQEKHVLRALEEANCDFPEGAVGAGRGMKCHDLKGGIGSASRQIQVDGKNYTLGALCLTNHGKYEDLVINHHPIGQEIPRPHDPSKDQGSVITLLATDLPLSSRQLKRLAKRAVVGLSQSGSLITNGSGEIVLAYSTANRIPHESGQSLHQITVFADDQLDQVFRAVKESVEEAVIHSLLYAESVTGYRNYHLTSLAEILPMDYFSTTKP